MSLSRCTVLGQVCEDEHLHQILGERSCVDSDMGIMKWLFLLSLRRHLWFMMCLFYLLLSFVVVFKLETI